MKKGVFGFSLFELLFSLLILGLILFLVFPAITGKHTQAREAVANAKLEELNRAVHVYSMAVQAIELPAGSEAQVLALLQQRLESAPGSPFFSQNYLVSSDLSSYRARWDGRGFVLLKRGEEGTGLDLQVR